MKTKFMYLLYGEASNPEIYEYLDQPTLSALLLSLDKMTDIPRDVYYRTGFLMALPKNTELRVKISSKAASNRVTRQVLQGWLSDPSYGSSSTYFIMLFMNHFERHLLADDNDTSSYEAVQSQSIVTPKPETSTTNSYPPIIVLVTWIIFGLQVLFFLVTIVYFIVAARRRRRENQAAATGPASIGKVSGSIWTRE
jgi:hypothetical protein